MNKSNEKGMRIVPLTWGAACWLIAGGLYYFVPHIITAIIGAFLLWCGWSCIRVGLFGSQKLIDAMTLNSEWDKDEEVVEEWRKINKLE